MRMMKIWTECQRVREKESESESERVRQGEREREEKEKEKPHLGAQNRPPSAHMPV